MKTPTDFYRSLPAKLLLTGTTALSMVMLAPQAYAQDVEQADEDEVVVTLSLIHI